jgi:IMP cyclohydrolase
MKNPIGPYPGRQLFLGLTPDNKACFAYLVTGRSAASRERMAVPIENGVRIGPAGKANYDPLRHYSALKYDNPSGVLAVSNGIQTEAIFETYKLIHSTGNPPGKDFLEKILDGAGAEPDPPINTPRIGAISTQTLEGESVFIIGIKAFGQPARAWEVRPAAGKMSGIAVYRGDLEKPEGTAPNSAPPELEIKENSAQSLSEYLFDISAASYKDADIRVCSVAGVRDQNRTWQVFIKNVMIA